MARLSRLMLTIVALSMFMVPVAQAAPTPKGHCAQDCLRVYSITLYTYLGPTVEAHVKVVDENGGGARGAVVHGEWTLPDGTTVDGYSMLGTRMRAEFPVTSNQTGTFTFTVLGITKAGYTFDPGGSALLSKSIDIGGASSGCALDCVTATSIDMFSRKGHVIADVTAVDQNGDGVRGASITATWTLPDGTAVTQTASANKRGRARFDVQAGPFGTYTITIEAMTAAGHTYVTGVTSGSYDFN